MKTLWKRPPTSQQGILCGADRAQEWLLPWWWSRYTQHHSYPITFCDFGMTEERRAWCRERGEVIPVAFDVQKIASRTRVATHLVAEWEGFYGQGIWNARPIWFRKPLACLHSPYEKTLWIDLDCEILGSLGSLFAAFERGAQLALVREPASCYLEKLSANVRYNGGVVLFAHGAPIVEAWAREALEKNHLFWGDDPLLSELIYTHQIAVQELPEKYNWRIACGLNLDAVIVHWVGTGGKAYIRAHGGLKPALDAFYAVCKKSNTNCKK